MFRRLGADVGARRTSAAGTTVPDSCLAPELSQPARAPPNSPAVSHARRFRRGRHDRHHSGNGRAAKAPNQTRTHERENTMRMIKSLVAALPMLVALTLSSTKAHAATESACTVATVQYDNSVRLVVWCNGVGSLHYAFGAGYGAACRSASVDTIKVWEAMLQSALLAGKKVDLDYTTDPGCFSGTVRIITQLRLQAN
jgi:hypothetical protein